MNEADSAAIPAPGGPAGANADITVPMRTGIQRVFLLAVFFELLWILLDTCIHFLRWIEHEDIRKIFNMAREENLPSIFAAGQAMICGLVLFGTWWIVKREGASKMVLAGWLFAAIYFFYIGVDDGARIHERVGSAIGEEYSDMGSDNQPQLVQNLMGMHTYYWQMFIAPILGLGLAISMGFMWFRYKGEGLRKFLVAGSALLGAAVVMDFFEGRHNVYEQWAENWGWEEYTVTHYMKVIEESIEMFGTSLFLFAFLTYLARRVHGMQVALSNDA